MAVSKLTLGTNKPTHTFSPALVGKLAGKLSVAQSMVDMGCHGDAIQWIEDKVYDAVFDLVQEAVGRLPLPLEVDVIEELVSMVSQVAAELGREVVSTAIGSVYSSQTDDTYTRFLIAFDGSHDKK